MTRSFQKSKKRSSLSQAKKQKLLMKEKRESALLALSLFITTSVFLIITLMIIVNARSKFGHIHLPFGFIFVDTLAIISTAWASYRWMRLRQK